MRLTLLFLAIFSAFAALAQDFPVMGYLYFEEGKPYHLLADQVNVRATASEKGAVLTKLPIGTPLTFLGYDKKFYQSNGINAPWCKVKFTDKGKSQTGYVWAPLIANQSLAVGKQLFLYGVDKVNAPKKGRDWPTVIVQMRLCQDNKQIAQASWETNADLQTMNTLSELGNKGLNGTKSIFKVEYSNGYCGGAVGAYFVAWTGQELLFMLDVAEGFDAPYFLKKEVFFPNDKGGKAGKIIIQSESGEYVDDSDEPQISEKTTESYTWDGKKAKLDK